MSSPYDRLAGLGLTLPSPAAPKGAYFPSRRCGEQLWISGSTARRPDDPGAIGVVGIDVTVEQAVEQARWAALNLVAAIDAAVGLDEVTALVQMRGFVRAASDFEHHPQVIDGASRLLMGVFGDDVGAHARTAIGVASLPGGACVELDLVAYVADAGASR